MSNALIFLTVVIYGLAVVPMVFPRRIFEYPYVVGLFLSVWLLPQAWAVEREGLAGTFDPTIAWFYMAMCIIFLVAGYAAGRALSGSRAQMKQAEVATMYNEKRMAQASAILIMIGGVSYFMMSRIAETTTYEAGWTGIIIVYALLAQCLVFGAALNFIIYLRTKSKSSLILFVIATSIFIPVLLVAVKREFIFEFAIIIFCSLFLIKNFVPPRALVIIGCVLGSIIVNNAGTLRGYVEQNNSSLIGAMTSSDVLSGKYAESSNMPPAPEVTGAVDDIAIANELGDYHPFVSLYNGMVSRYFPALIFGRDAKNSMMIKTDTENSLTQSRYYATGATRTGFSDTFQDYWYFGVLAFAFLGFTFGWIYSFALIGGLRYQYLYVSLLGLGLHGITHSFQEFICSLPFLFLVVWLPFRYARITHVESQRLARASQLQVRS